MYICVKCKKEMVCNSIGVAVRFRDGTHVYMGDAFKCDHCGTEIIATNNISSFDTGVYDRIKNGEEINKVDDRHNFWMDT